MDRCRRMPRLERLEPRIHLAADSALPEVRLFASAGQSFISDSLYVENVLGLRGATVRVSVNPQLLQQGEAIVRAGSAWNGRATAVANVDAALGLIDAFIFSSQEVARASGRLIDIEVLAPAGAAAMPITASPGPQTPPAPPAPQTPPAPPAMRPEGESATDAPGRFVCRPATSSAPWQVIGP